MSAYQKELGEFTIHRAMRRTSGGMGKKEDSQKASTKRASPPYGVLAQCIIQALKSFTQSKISMITQRSKAQGQGIRAEEKLIVYST
jgi:hypothetical protein